MTYWLAGWCAGCRGTSSASSVTFSTRQTRAATTGECSLSDSASTGAPYSEQQCLFHESSFFGGGDFLTKTCNPLQRLPNSVLQIFFFGRDSELQIYHRNFLIVDNKHRKLFAIKQSKRCKCVPKMHQNTFGGRAGSLRELMRSPRPPSRNGAYF